jgi:uncharacterized protein (TIGR03083 family)
MTDTGELTHTRVHLAPPELLFACMTTPEHLTRFWGPTGTTTPLDRILVEPRVGGAFETVMVNDADGAEYAMRAVFTEFEPPERLAWREVDSGMTTTVTYRDLGEGTTEVVTHQTGVPAGYLSPEARAGFTTSLDRFDSYLGDDGALLTSQFLALADVLAGQPADAWDAPSLCSRWRVREVVAHLTMPVRYGPAEFGAEMAAAGGDFGVLSDRVAARDGARTPADLLADLRSPVLHAWLPPGGGMTGALTHVVIHGLDVTLPLGAGRSSTDDAVRVVLDGLGPGGGHAHFGVDLTGRSLVATDLDWRFGGGDGDGARRETAAPAGALAAFLAGRTIPPG